MFVFKLNKVKNLEKFKSSYQTTNPEIDSKYLAFQRIVFIGSASIISKCYFILIIKNSLNQGKLSNEMFYSYLVAHLTRW